MSKLAGAEAGGGPAESTLRDRLTRPLFKQLNIVRGGGCRKVQMVMEGSGKAQSSFE